MLYGQVYHDARNRITLLIRDPALSLVISMRGSIERNKTGGCQVYAQ